MTCIGDGMLRFWKLSTLGLEHSLSLVCGSSTVIGCRRPCSEMSRLEIAGGGRGRCRIVQERPCWLQGRCRPAASLYAMLILLGSGQQGSPSAKVAPFARLSRRLPWIPCRWNGGPPGPAKLLARSVAGCSVVAHAAGRPPDLIRRMPYGTDAGSIWILKDAVETTG
jgi:hypothetical protein